MFKAILFDLDGLLIDSESIYRKISYQMADRFEVTLHDGIWAKQMGRSPLESLTIFREELGITSHSAQELVDMRNVMLQEAFRNGLTMMPGALEFIQAYHGRLRMAVATGSQRVLMDLALDRFGLREYFEYLLPSDDLTAGKPDPEIYLRTAAALQLKPEECIVLEDSSNGALAGHRAGCYVIAVPSEYTCNQDFSFCDHVAQGLGELLTTLDNLLG
jgi:HAD superfamily hydrolase (TIGR01509 family)